MTHLPPSEPIFYRVGDGTTWSTERRFVAPAAVGPESYPYTLGVVADVGESADANATMTHLLKAAPRIDSLIIAGDIAYANGNGPVWDAFQRMAEPVSSTNVWSVNAGK